MESDLTTCKCQYPGCGKLFVAKHPSARWCPECRADGIRLVSRECARKRSAKIRQIVRVCGRYGCNNTFTGCEERRFCDKCGEEGKRRGNSGRHPKGFIPEPLFKRDPSKPVVVPDWLAVKISRREKVKTYTLIDTSTPKFLRIIDRWTKGEVDLI